MERCIELKNKYFYNIDQIHGDISNLIGNKSYNTFLLQSNGFNVPKSIFASTDLFDSYITNIVEFDKVIKNLQHHLIINNFTDSLAIRSSALLTDNDGNVIKEDSESISMAGWFKSSLNVPIDNIKEAIIDCYSVVTSYVLNQNIKNHFNDNIKVQIALLIQDFYEAEKSAVIFTKNQYAYNRGDFLITATYGACNGLVSGEITGDSYWINRENSLINRKYISKKTKMYTNGLSSIDLVDVPYDIQKLETLSYKDIKNLFDLGISIENSFKFPQDIELVYNSAYGWIIVQTRPINYWRNENV